jgi:hypothetical protein
MVIFLLKRKVDIQVLGKVLGLEGAHLELMLSRKINDVLYYFGILSLS